MQKKRWSPSARERRGDFSRDQAGLAHSAGDDTPFAREQNLNRSFKAGIEPCENILNRLRLNLQHAPRRLQAHEALQRRTTELRLFNLRSSAPRCASGKAFGPSERAAAGLSCVSRKIPSTPAATAARANGSMNCG